MKRVVSIVRLLLAMCLLLAGSMALQAQVLDRKQAEDFIKQGEYVKALDTYKSINAKHSTLESVLDLAQTYKKLRNHDEAEKYFRMATRYPDCPFTAYCDLGDMLMFNGKYDEARTSYYSYATLGGDPSTARIRIFSCDSARAIAARPPFFSVANERRINTKYSEFCVATAPNNYVVFTSDRPIDYKSTDPEELAATLAMLQGVGSDVAPLLLLRNAQDPTDVTAFNKRNEIDSLNVVHSIYDGDEFDTSSEKVKSKRRAQQVREQKQMEKLREKKKKTYGGTGRPYLNMYVVSRQAKADNPGKGVLGNIVWTAPQMLLPPLNTGDHTGPCAFTPDGNTMYFCFSELLTDAAMAASSGDGVSHVGLMISHKNEDATWSNPVFFPYNKRSSYSLGHPCISKDGRTLYFSSNMPGSLGGHDIFKCELGTDGTWLPPENLGSTINTIRDELFPTLDSEGRLYFSSDGHPGLGGLDIFRAKGKSDAWTSVENLRKPVNSSSDDFSFTFLQGAKNLGVFSSNRPGGYGDDDIYSFKLASGEVKPEPKGKPLIAVRVVNRLDSMPVEGAQLTLLNLKTKKGEVMTTDGDGRAFFAVAPKSFYSLASQVAGYLPSGAEGISTNKIKAGESIKIILPLDPLTSGGSFKVENVYYDYGKAVLKKAAFKELDKVVKFMNLNPGVKIELSSHTDSRGGLAGNMSLSQKRAESCVIYLVKKGIAKDRVVPKGYGPTKLLIKNAKTEKQHAKNRRTEIKILEVQ